MKFFRSSPANAAKVPAATAASTRFGIKLKLQIAFGAVAVMTVIAAAVAIMSFSQTEPARRRPRGGG